MGKELVDNKSNKCIGLNDTTNCWKDNWDQSRILALLLCTMYEAMRRGESEGFVWNFELIFLVQESWTGVPISWQLDSWSLQPFTVSGI